jgi:uncharacterized protein YodC (DUF2158 family)
MTAKSNHRVGDIVRLRSGSPAFTVCGTYTNAGVACINVMYFNNVTGKIETGSLSESCVVPVSSIPQPPEDVKNLRNTSVAQSTL